MENTAQIKDVAIQLTNLAIVNFNDKTLTGEQRERKVIDFLVKLDDNIPLVNFIPNELEAAIVDLGLDNVQAYFHDHSPIDFVKKCYNRIKHIFKK